MGAREDGVKKDLVAAATFGSAAGELSGVETVGQAGVDLGGLGPTGLDGGHLRPQVLFGSAAGEVSAVEAVGQAGVDLGGVGFTGLDGGHLRPQDLFGSAGGVLDHASKVVGPGGGVNDLGSPRRLIARPFLGRGPAGGAHQAPVLAPAGHAGDPRGQEGDKTGVAVPYVTAADFRRAGGELGAAMRPAALLAMVLGAATLIGAPDAPWPNHLVALLIWLAGCAGLFVVSRH